MATFNFIRHRCFPVGIDIQRGGVKKNGGAAFFPPGTALWQLFSKLSQRFGNNHDLQVLVCAIAMPSLLTQTNGMSSIVHIIET